MESFIKIRNVVLRVLNDEQKERVIGDSKVMVEYITSNPRVLQSGYL